jgi:tetratricopeptide (TPR) repeat protein
VAASGRRLRLAHLVVWSDWFIAKASCCLGDYGRALSMLREKVELCQRIGDRAWRTRGLNTTGWVLAEIGAEDRSRAFNDAATQLAHEVGDSEIISNSEINLAWNHIAAGRLDDAAGYLDRLHAEIQRPGDPWMRWRWSVHVEDACGRLALARRDPAAALGFADAALAGARRFGARKLEVRGETLRGRALLALERLDDAEQAIAAALDAATAIAYPAGRWRALRLRAEAARRRGDAKALAAAEAELARALGTLAASLPEDELRRALYAAAAVLLDGR